MLSYACQSLINEYLILLCQKNIAATNHEISKIRLLLSEAPSLHLSPEDYTYYTNQLDSFLANDQKLLYLFIDFLDSIVSLKY